MRQVELGNGLKNHSRFNEAPLLEYSVVKSRLNLAASLVIWLQRAILAFASSACFAASANMERYSLASASVRCGVGFVPFFLSVSIRNLACCAIS